MTMHHAAELRVGSTDRFGVEWSRYPELRPAYRTQLLDWITPLVLADFQNKMVLDAGCGMGRNSYWIAEAGARRVVACDLDERTLAAARRTLARFRNAEVVACSVYALPWRDLFDVVISIGVIHHLEDPGRAVANLVAATKPGGTILVWVYAHEGNERLLRFLRPLRTITSRLPTSITHTVAYLCSAPLYVLLRLRQTRHPYAQRMHTWTFRHLHAVVFDQLLPRIARYWTNAEARALFAGLPVTSVRTTWVNRNSWSIVAQRL
ncbi:MAG: class I SAM-dependent methyltransferase [bacterium]|nr:class I SAM-dependent methyltransferase [bacterium]